MTILEARLFAEQRMAELAAQEPPYVAGWKTLSGMVNLTASGLLLQYFEHQVEMGRERAVLQEARHDGCWCLGIGGWVGSLVQRMDASPPTYNEAIRDRSLRDDFCPCPDGAAALAGAQREREELRRADMEHRTARHWELCGIPADFRGYRLETSPLRESMPDLVRAMQEMRDPKQWWFLSGAFGVGKTGAAIGYAWEFLNRTGGSILFRTMPDLLTELRATYNRPSLIDEHGREIPPAGQTEAQVIAGYVNVGLLIIDDIGAEQLKDTGENSWVADRLYQIIGKRHDEGRPVVITSNHSLTVLYGRIGERVVWRIVESCGGKAGIIQVQGPNQRMPK